jgi:hypothetical protein
MTNEHGDSFYRQNDFEDCGPVSGEGYEDFPPGNQQYYNNNRPSPIESDYFYDQYVDFPINDTQGNTLNNSQLRYNSSSPYMDFNQNKFTLNQFPPRPPPPTSAFTFFGHPLPSLGNIWGAGRAANRASSGENSSRGKGRVQIFKAGDPEMQVVFNRPTNELETSDLKNRDTAASVKNQVVDKVEEKLYRPFFQTPFFNQPPPTQVKPEFGIPTKSEFPPQKAQTEKVFSQPRPEKGFAPMIPGSVGGFIPIQEPTATANDTEAAENNSWPKDYEDESLKQVPLVTRTADTVTRKAVIKPAESYITAQVEKVHYSPTTTQTSTAQTTTISHLQTSISPILSTLNPKPELITEKSKFDNAAIETDSGETIAHESDIRSGGNNVRDKFKFEEETYRRESSTRPSTTTQSHHHASVEEIEEVSENGDDFNETTNLDLSADHLIAPGSILSQEVVQQKSPISLPSLVKAGKITKVFTTAPTITQQNSNEISKLLSPFYQQQHPNDDNEFQPNQIYPQTLDGSKSAEHSTDQYQREDMQWYFQNYHNNSNPILNYNSQPYDNRYGHYNSCNKMTSLSLTNVIFVVVIIASYFH